MRDLGDAADAEDAVVALMTAVGVFDRGGEERREERLVGLAVLGLDPAQVAGLRRRRAVRRDGLGDVLPGLAALQVASAWSALALAAATWAAVGSVASVSVSGATSMTQPWRDAGVVASWVSCASMSASVTVTPCCSASVAWSLLSMSRSSEIGMSCLRCWVDDLVLDVRLGLGQAPGDGQGPDAALGLVEPPVLDGRAVAQVGLGDGLAVHAPDRGEIVVVVVRPGPRSGG